ncbi:MAG TPA: hypothetical protein VH063_12525 [Gaiellaceae bacterium]|nr:hypothetical protein [Gaiellaceae bacterium]
MVERRPLRSRLARALLAAALLGAGGIAVVQATAGTSSLAAWTSWGNSPARTADAAAEPSILTRAFVLPLGGRITNQVLAANGAYFVGTSTGAVVSFTPAGVVRWKVQLGQLASRCAQLDGYGMTGTGVIDPASRTLYVMDAFGRLHALSLATGAEEPGWPVQVYTDFRKELDWGALTLVDGSVYVPTASYCDTAGTPGAVYKIDTASRTATQWLSVPLASGGGGGPWGWGGVAYDAALNTLFTVTSGAFDGGTNTGDAYSEFVGYGDQLVQLDPDLTVASADHPPDIPDRMDLDYVGSPVIFTRPGCGQLVAATDKDDTVYLWHANAIASGPVAEVHLQAYNAADPMLAQLAWSPALDSLYTATGTQLVRIAVAVNCSAAVGWSDPLGTQTENGSPTISGNTVWITVNGKPVLDGFDAATGKRLVQDPLGGTTLTAPTIVGKQLVIGTFTGLVEGFGLSSKGASPQ